MYQDRLTGKRELLPFDGGYLTFQRHLQSSVDAPLGIRDDRARLFSRDEQSVRLEFPVGKKLGGGLEAGISRFSGHQGALRTMYQRYDEVLTKRSYSGDARSSYLFVIAIKGGSSRPMPGEMLQLFSLRPNYGLESATLVKGIVAILLRRKSHYPAAKSHQVGKTDMGTDRNLMFDGKLNGLSHDHRSPA